MCAGLPSGQESHLHYLLIQSLVIFGCQIKEERVYQKWQRVTELLQT
jgi:hypothetical protein